MRTTYLSQSNVGANLVATAGKSFRAGAFLGLFGVAAASGTAVAAPCNVPDMKHATIQSAVNDLTCNEIVVADGVFTEQVTINRLGGISIHGMGAGRTTIMSPAKRTRALVLSTYLPDFAYVVQVKSGSSANITDLTIDGGGTAHCGENYFGVRFHQASGTLDRVVVQNVSGSGTSFACPNVIAVGVTTNSPGPAKGVSLGLHGSTIRSFQQIGAVANGPKASLTMENTVIHGAGSQSSQAQVGVQVSAGAMATLDRMTITNIQYSGDPCKGIGTGISLSGAGTSSINDSVFNTIDRGVLLSKNAAQVTVSKSRFVQTLGGILSTGNTSSLTSVVQITNNAFISTARSTAATVATCFNDSGDGIAVSNEKGTLVSGNSAADSARCAIELLTGTSSLDVEQNQSVRSALYDISDQGSGNSLTKNLCLTSSPAGLCAGTP